MKFISGVFKFFAFLLMCLVILLLPLSLFARNLGEIVFTKDVVSTLIEDHLLDEEVIANLAFDMINTVSIPDGGFEGESAGEGESSIPNMMLDSFKDLEREQLVLMFEAILPTDLIVDIVDSLFDDLYGWLDSDATLPELVVDLKPIKTNTKENGSEIVGMVFDAFPDCTDQEIDDFVINLGLKLVQVSETPSIPLCKPPEPYYSQLNDYGSEVILTMIDSMPDQMDLSSNLTSENNDFAALKQLINYLRFGMQTTWIIVILLFLIALPMGARSFPQYFKWAAWPLILSGLIMLGFMMGLKLSSTTLVSMVSTNLFSQIPAPAAAIIENILTSLLSIFGVPFRNQGLMLFIGGGVLFVLGSSFAAFRKMNIQNTVNVEPEYPPDFDSMSITSAPVEEEEKVVEDDSNEDDAIGDNGE